MKQNWLTIEKKENEVVLTKCSPEAEGEIIIPHGVTQIGCHTRMGFDGFYGCQRITSVIIPQSVIGINGCSFMDCSSLASIHFPEKELRINGNPFEGTAWYENQPDGVVYAGLTAVCYKGAMPKNSEIEIKFGTKAIASGFWGVSVNNSPFKMSNICSVKIPNTVEYIGICAFQNCDCLKSINIPNNVKVIERDTFNRCTSLSSMIVPEGVEEIKNGAFYGCKNLISIIISTSIKKIEDHAFFACDNLTSVKLGMTKPVEITSTTFTNRFNATLCVPKGSKAAYEKADFWKEFKEIIEY